MDKEQQEHLVNALLDAAALKENQSKDGTLDPKLRERRRKEVDTLLSLAILIERWNTLQKDVRMWQFFHLRKRCGGPERLLQRISEAVGELDNSQMCG